MDFYDFCQRLEGTWMRGDDRCIARCPAHDDLRASLSVRDAGDKILVYCHAGCSLESITEALGLSLSDLFYGDDYERETEIDERYHYRDSEGRILYTKIRWRGKRFSYRNRDGTWGYSGNKVLYRLDDLIDGLRLGHEVWIVEGEKDVDNLYRQGKTATTAGGTNDWSATYPRYFIGASVVIVADADEAGRRSANYIGDSLFGIAERIRIVEAAVGKDISDHLEAGLPLSEVKTCKTLHLSDWTLSLTKTTETLVDVWGLPMNEWNNQNQE